jgi:hypothetical protein
VVLLSFVPCERPSFVCGRERIEPETDRASGRRDQAGRVLRVEVVVGEFAGSLDAQPGTAWHGRTIMRSHATAVLVVDVWRVMATSSSMCAGRQDKRKRLLCGGRA